MNNDSILENLRILKIYKSDQLKNQDLSFWHLKTYKQNISNEEELIIINNAKEELDTLNNEDLRKILDEQTFSKQNDNKSPIKKENNQTYFEYNQSINDLNNNSSNPNTRIKQEKELVGIEVFEKAERFFDRKDYQRAVNFYSQLSSSMEFDMLAESKKIRLYNRRGISLRHLKKYDKAILDFNAAIELDNNEPNLYFNRGKCKHYREQWESAIIDFNKAISLRKLQDPEFYYFRGLSKNGLKQFQDALKDLTIAINLEPQREEFKVAKNFAEKKLVKQKKEQIQFYDNEEYKKYYEDKTKKINKLKKEQQKKSENLTYRGVEHKSKKLIYKKNYLNKENLLESYFQSNAAFKLPKIMRYYYIFCGIILLIYPPIAIFLGILGLVFTPWT